MKKLNKKEINFVSGGNWLELIWIPVFAGGGVILFGNAFQKSRYFNGNNYNHRALSPKELDRIMLINALFAFGGAAIGWLTKGLAYISWGGESEESKESKESQGQNPN